MISCAIASASTPSWKGKTENVPNGFESLFDYCGGLVQGGTDTMQTLSENFLMDFGNLWAFAGLVDSPRLRGSGLF